ncbi:MAG: MATE family efflux transporter [Lachnospiraceae bacterium]|nr:MATE family efflux transporter [Lachnospiraceae bacterium]
MEQKFFRTVCNLAVPVALQSMLQASFSIIDQIMIGQLGSVSVAGVGLAGKFSSIFNVVVSAIGAVAGIMISQYMGQKNDREVARSFFVNLGAAAGLAVLFMLASFLLPEQILGLYTQDRATVLTGAGYLFLLGGMFLPMAGAVMLSAMLRCMEKASLPLYASIVAAVLNTALNYVLIFGHFGFAAMGADGAAVATVISQLANCLIMLVMMLRYRSVFRVEKGQKGSRFGFRWKQYAAMLMPLLICEFMWSLGENVYTGIYGHLGTAATAAMTLSNPVQGLLIGALCGLSQAAAVIIGKKLGNGEYEDAYQAAKKLLFYGFVGSLVLSACIILLSPLYVMVYQVEDNVRMLTRYILIAYAVVAPFKVQNMILGGGVLRSGGKTEYVMFVDLIGTWIFGVPLGMLSAFVLRLPVHWVYFILSLEECVRFGISVVIFRKRKWMQKLKS